MPSYLAKTDIPRDKRDVVHLLFLVDDDIDQLNPEQIAAIRAIYHLDSDVTVEQLIRDQSKGDISVSSHPCSCGGKCVSDSSLCGLIGTDDCKRSDAP